MRAELARILHRGQRSAAGDTRRAPRSRRPFCPAARLAPAEIFVLLQDPRPATILSPAAPHPQPSHTRRRCIRLQECALLSLPARAAAASHLQTLPMVKYEP